MKIPLTSKQQAIYSKVRSSIETVGHSPTLKELQTFLSVGSMNTVVSHLNALEKKGYIIRHKHAKRNIELRNTESHRFITTTISVPVVASVGCDDLSVFTNEQHDESLEIDNKIISGKKNVVAVRAIGNSMDDADIHHGDYVLIELTDQAENGDRVAAIIGDMVTVKRFERHDNMIILRPESKDPIYKPIILSGDFSIAGRVLCTIPSASRDITEMVYV